MDQRQLRLGDILDDYCSRERRITNHAIVAMVGAVVQRTRCVTCDAEHVYKAAKVPPVRKRKQVSVPPGEPVEADVKTPPVGRLGPAPVSVPLAAAVPDVEASPAMIPEPIAPEEATEPEGPVHRPLIRATLPRLEGQTTVRPVPEFTVRQSGGRNGQFRDGDQRGSRGGRPPGTSTGRPAGQGGHRQAGGQNAGQRKGREGNGRPSGLRPAGRPQGKSRFGRRNHPRPPGKKHSK